MADKLVVGPIDKGLKTNVTPFNIDNDSFPILINAYQWRGRVKRKRGTSLLCRLQRFFNSSSVSYIAAASSTITLDGSGNGNLITGFNLQTNANIVPGSVTITDSAARVYTDPAMDGTLNPSGTINYATGAIVIVASAGLTITAIFRYNPQLPVMGLEEINLNPNQLSQTMAFDTTYSYIIEQTSPFASHDVSFYKNLPTGSYPGYIQKTNWTPVKWNGQTYQQFWTTNYEGAFWATNGVTVPFSITNIGMQYKFITGVTIDSAGPPALATLTIVNHGLVQGDFVFINEVEGITGINFQTGYVVSADPQAANTVQVEFPDATLGGAYAANGIAQYLTNNSDPTKDCIRWFDGDPTDGSSTSPSFSTGKGWVNFMPPLSREPFSIADLPKAQYYLAGAKMIIPFKDSLLCLGAVVQTSAADSQVYLQDTVIFSQNGTPYYTVSFTGDPSLATTTFTSILTPPFQLTGTTTYTATPSAWWEDQPGFGGYLTAGVNDAITTCSFNEDVLIVGFTGFQTRLVYSGSSLIPFNFFSINSELGSSSTFSFINMDRGVITKGSRAFILTSQIGAERIDTEIPDQNFEVKLSENGNERVTAQRDFINEWVYFTYPRNTSDYIFPNQTLLFNYRDNSYAIFNEAYTTYGPFRKQNGFTWANIGTSLSPPQWAAWNTPWNSGYSTAFQPDVIAGNQQGFVLVKDDQKIASTGEGISLYIHDISGNVVTSPNHCLDNLDYIYISGALGAVGTQINGQIFQIYNATNDTFELNPSIVADAYSGGGLITRMYVPFIQTKQFPLGWDLGRKVRIGSQLYLLTKTPNGHITVQIYLSQNDEFPYNAGAVVPAALPINNSLIYSSVVNTSPEIILNGVFNIPLGNIGDGVTLTYNLNYQTIFNIAGTIFRNDPTQPEKTLTITIGNVATFTDDGLGGFTATGTGTSVGSSIIYETGAIVLAFTVAPSSEASKSSFYYYAVNIISPSQNSQSQIWHKMNTSLIGDSVQLGFTLSDEQMRDTSFSNQFAEIELHGFILDISPSQVLT